MKKRSQKKGVNSQGDVCLSPAMQLHSPPVLPVSVSATDPVSLLTSAEKQSEKHRKKRREGGNGVEVVVVEIVLRGGGRRREALYMLS